MPEFIRSFGRPLELGPSLAWIVFLSICGYSLLVPWFGQSDPMMADFSRAGLPPGEGGVFGTDSAGHELFYRVAEGLRISLSIALITACSSAALGTLLGIIAGAAGGWLDRTIMRLTDTLNALPHLLLGVLIVSFFRGSVTAIIASLVLTHWTTIARTVRAQILSLRHAEYIEAAWLGGMSRRSIIWHHLVPAALGQAFIGLVLLIPHTIWHESTLSFLGLGLPVHKASLGTLLADAQGALLLGQWWLLLFPGGMLVGATLAIAAIGADFKDRLLGSQESLR